MAEANPYLPYKGMLLGHARWSMREGVRKGYPPELNLDGVPEPLLEKRATFITLNKRGRLRGCIGRLEATRPLFVDVAHNAVAAALEDHRFPPVSEGEIPHIAISISVLTPPQAIQTETEGELIANLRPSVDGLIIREGGRRATFLPSVWEDLPLPLDFIRHLKVKAGLPPDYWSDSLAFATYQTYYLNE